MWGVHTKCAKNVHFKTRANFVMDNFKIELIYVESQVSARVKNQIKTNILHLPLLGPMEQLIFSHSIF